MKVFISWSGQASRELAEALRDWLPKVLQNLEPFISSKDIDKGAFWASELAKELADSAFGIVCVTHENLASPWLNYEAGAISTAVAARVCPLLLGMDKSEVSSPLSQLQLTNLTMPEMQMLAQSLNNAAGKPLKKEAVDEAVETWWPKLQARIDSILVPTAGSGSEAVEPPKPEVTADDALSEILHLMRGLDRRLRSIEGGQTTLRHLNRSVGAPPAAGRLSGVARSYTDIENMDLLQLIDNAAHRFNLNLGPVRKVEGDGKVVFTGGDSLINAPKELFDYLSTIATATGRSIQVGDAGDPATVVFHGDPNIKVAVPT